MEYKQDHWSGALFCPLCHGFYRRPRTLPCGHTFCLDCLDKLRDESLKESRPLCTNTKRGDSVHLRCPQPNCVYVIKVMNVARWALRNRAIADTVSGYKRHLRDKKEVSTQTDVTMESAIISIPRGLTDMFKTEKVDGADNSSFMDKVMPRALSMDSLHPSYVPNGMSNWKSCMALVGANILEQLFHF